jgi:hypothetical protein
MCEQLRRWLMLSAVASLILSSLGQPTYAHHSRSIYDLTRYVAVSGVVNDWHGAVRIRT